MVWPKKRTITLLISLLIVILTLYLSGIFSKKASDPWLLIPDNAALIIEVEHPKALYESFSGKNEFWKSLLSVKEFEDLNSILRNLDSTDIGRFPKLNDLFGSPMLISIHPLADGSKFSYLISVKNNQLRNNEDLSTWAGQILNNSFDVETTGKLKNAIFIKRSGTKNGAYVVIHNKTLLISSDVTLLVNTVNEYINKDFHFSKTLPFQQLKQTAGKNVNAHFYINYKNLFEVVSPFFKDELRESMEWMKNFAGWSVLDLLIRNEELLLNGYTDVENSKQYLAKYSNDIPATNTIYHVLPGNTAFLLNIGSSDYSNKIDHETKAKLSEITGVNIENLFSTLGSEICLSSSATNKDQIRENSWFIIKLKDKQEGAKYFEQLAENGGTKDVAHYEGYIYRRIGFEKFLNQLFDIPAQFIENDWYTLAGDFVVFANSPSALTNYISAIELGKTLDKNENFTAFSFNLSKSSTINLLLELNEFDAQGEYFLSNSPKNNILSTFLNAINLLSFQFSPNEPYFYTSFSANHRKKYKEEKPYLWKFQLESKLASQVFTVKNTQDVIVFDELFIMYCISSQGNLKWKKRLDSPLLGNVHEITNSKTKVSQLLFNTKDYIYLLNPDGEQVPGFPVQLLTSATNGLTIYSNSNEQRIVMAQSNKKVYNYTMEGMQVKGWKLPEFENIVSEQITCFEVKNKIFMVIEEDNGRSFILDKFGSRTNINKPVDKAPNSKFYENKTNSKGAILTTNKHGKLTYISEKGEVQFTDFGKFSPDHYFLYEDFNYNRENDFIYIDEKNLLVFDRFKKVIFDYTFNSGLKTAPVFHKIDSKQNMLGFAPENENSIYFFDNKGELKIFKGLPENASFAISSNNDGEVNLVIGNDNSVYYHRLQ
jgi:hypothetical protein